jgi:hypothetical protein
MSTALRDPVRVQRGRTTRMTRLLRTARAGCAKLEKPLCAAEIGGCA